MITEEFYTYLSRNTSEFLETLRSCSDEELKFKEDGKWSVLEIAEHILIAERAVNLLLLKNSENKSEKAELYGFDRLNRMVVGMRARKIEAPGSFQPKGALKSVEEFEAAIRGMRDNLLENLDTGKVVIDGRVFKHPALGEMTIRDWLYFIPLHASRHNDQIKDRLAFIRKKD